MTRSDHVSGTDRVLEAAESIGVPDDAVGGQHPGRRTPRWSRTCSPILVAPFSFADTKADHPGEKNRRNRSPELRPGQKWCSGSTATPSIFPGPPDSPTTGTKKKAHTSSISGFTPSGCPVLRKFVQLGPSRLEGIEKTRTAAPAGKRDTHPGGGNPAREHRRGPSGRHRDRRQDSFVPKPLTNCAQNEPRNRLACSQGCA